MIGIIDMRSLGYYKIKQGILQQNLSRYYRFEKAEKLCEYFNKFVNTLQKEREQKLQTDKYPWLDPDDERKHMTDREILEEYIDLNNSCLDKEEKTKVMYMLFKYREAFSLREIGTCPNIEVKIDVTDKSPFFIRPYHVREEDKEFIDKEMKRLYYMGILKEGFSAYSNPVMLISRKLTKDKRVVTDFRPLNMRIAKKQFGLSTSQGHIFCTRKLQMWGTISIRSERCLSFCEIIRKFKKVLWNTSIFQQFFLFISKNAYGIKHLTIDMAIIY